MCVHERDRLECVCLCLCVFLCVRGMRASVRARACVSVCVVLCVCVCVCACVCEKHCISHHVTPSVVLRARILLECLHFEMSSLLLLRHVFSIRDYESETSPRGKSLAPLADVAVGLCSF